MDEAQMRAVCAQYGADFFPPSAGSRVGIAIQSLDQQPLNGMRIGPDGDVCGWFLWGGGEPPEEAYFYLPMCVDHLTDVCPEAVPFLGLPPGWRFLTDGDDVDVWFDAALIEGRAASE
jgi:hypothetical protein